MWLLILVCLSPSDCPLSTGALVHDSRYPSETQCKLVGATTMSLLRPDLAGRFRFKCVKE